MGKQRPPPGAESPVGDGEQRLMPPLEPWVQSVDLDRPCLIPVELGKFGAPTSFQLVVQQRHELLWSATERDHTGRDPRRLDPDRDGGRACGLRYEQERIAARQPAELAELVARD